MRSLFIHMRVTSTIRISTIQLRGTSERRACAPPRGPDPDRGAGNAVPRRPTIEPVIVIVIAIVIDIVIVIVIVIVILPVIRPAKRESTRPAAAAGRLLPVHRACQGVQ